jgi:Fe2+ transport system protein B
MKMNFLFILFLHILPSCATKHSDIEICFENVKNRINSDSILNKMAYSTIDSYLEFDSIINDAVNEESKSDSTCSVAVNKFILENKYSITVANLMLFQEFQAYLKHEKFNYSKALDNALKQEAEWK